MLIKVPSKDTETVVAALSKHVLKLPATLRRSLTWDRGHEMAKHKSFTVDTNVKVYFCDPQSPWQRGSNENTNGLLRQYFPKKTDLSVYSLAHPIRSPCASINDRERPWAFKRQQMNCKQMLHRPVEPAGICGNNASGAGTIDSHEI
jgi:IS30 family transposase